MQPMPKQKGADTVSWSIRIEPHELELWKRAAALEPTTASHLVRRAANREARRIIAQAKAEHRTK